jgi:predicted nucleic acid-binding protein
VILVDTPVWSLALRRRAGSLSPADGAVVAEWRSLVEAGTVVLAGPVRQEVLTGIRDASAFERLRGTLEAFEELTLSREDFEEAARAMNRCLGIGVAATSVDALLAAAASRRGHALFTLDRDLERLARVLPLRLHQWADRR